MAEQDMTKAMPQGEVERWGVYELALKGPREGNPFLDVQLRAQFKQGERAARVLVIMPHP